MALISRLVIHSKHNDARTIEQKAIQVGWATGGWAAAPPTDFSPLANAARLSVRRGIQKRERTDNRTDFARAIPLDPGDNSHLHYL